MPHSSGGSSHSGGSHSGSSSSSSSSSRSSSGGSSGGSASRISSTPFRGSRRFLYYKDSKPNFIYTNYDVRKKSYDHIIIWAIFFVMLLGPFLGIGGFMAVQSVNFPKKITYFKNKDVEFVVEDNLGVVKDEENLKRAMKDFYKETGIVPAVITVSNDTWNKNYKNLEAYAYDVSLDLFPDEAHWLIIYSTAVKEDGFDDWFCETMQGDRTDPVITEARGKEFNDVLYKRLLQRDQYSVDGALAATFDDFTPKMMRKKKKKAAQFYAFAIMFFGSAIGGVLSLVSAIHKTKEQGKYKHAVPCDLNAVYQGSCNYCGGVYIVGMHTECPHCGAALPPQNYVQDPQGNLIQIFNTKPSKPV